MQTAFVIVAVAASLAQAQPPAQQRKADAFAVVSQSMAIAAKENKNLWIMFDASW